MQAHFYPVVQSPSQAVSFLCLLNLLPARNQLFLRLHFCFIDCFLYPWQLVENARLIFLVQPSIYCYLKYKYAAVPVVKMCNPYLQIFLVIHADEILPRLGILRNVRQYALPPLQSSMLHNTTTHHSVRRPLKRIRTIQNGEVGYANLVGIAIDNGRHSKIGRIHLFGRNMELKVPAVVELGPLQLAVRRDQGLGSLVGLGQSDVLAIRRGRGYGSAGKL